MQKQGFFLSLCPIFANILGDLPLCLLQQIFVSIINVNLSVTI